MKKLLVGLGAASLALAFAVTPLSGVYADQTAGADITVTVNVIGEAPSVTINSPLDGSKYYVPTVPVKDTYENTTSIAYQLELTDNDGNHQTYNLPTTVVSGQGEGLKNGTDAFDIDMSTQTDGIFGYYVLTATASGTDTATDRVQFEYRALRLEDPSKKEENTGNPYVDVHYNAGVDHVGLQVFDKDGNAMFPSPIILENTVGPDMRQTLIDLFSVGAPSGEYRVVGTPYDAANNIVDITDEVTVSYNAPEVPVVPNTGFFTTDFGVSEQDFIASISIIFFASVAIMILAVRKKTQQKSQATLKRRK